eukprot:TRINITY_DN13822_c0_g1_i1.p1 TRINITY_DN13822_c0_g1~~TRINITY_DN13822_c0_g1_i1.p1  ORF type:complete len:685 (+),score=150.39 TRINITY_DN13822_c0_g1_i1:414-2468(+)
MFQAKEGGEAMVVAGMAQEIMTGLQTQFRAGPLDKGSFLNSININGVPQVLSTVEKQFLDTINKIPLVTMDEHDFRMQWANADVLPAKTLNLLKYIDLPPLLEARFEEDGVKWDGVEAGLPASLHLSPEKADAIWDPKNPLSFMNYDAKLFDGGVRVWAEAVGDSVEAATRIQKEFGLTAEQMRLLFIWFNRWVEYVNLDLILQNVISNGGDSTVKEAADLGYFHWGQQDNLLHGSIQSQMPFPGNLTIPEFGWWAHTAGFPKEVEFTAAESEALLGTLSAPNATALFLRLQAQALQDPTGPSAHQLHTMFPFLDDVRRDALAAYLTENLAGGILSGIYSDVGVVGNDGRHSGLLITRSVHEWALHGFVDPLVSLLSPAGAKARFCVCAGEANMTTPDDARMGPQGPILPDVAGTGKGNHSNINILRAWHGNGSIEPFRPPGPVDGFDGDFFNTPFPNERQDLWVWVSVSFRTLLVRWQEDVKTLGIKMHRYRLDLEQLLPTSENQYRYDAYYPATTNITSPLGIPVTLSKALFLDCEPLQNSVEGLPPPDPEKHDILLDIEPYSGVIMHAHRRLQTNLQIMAHTMQVFHAPVTSRVVPACWSDVWGTVTEHNAKEFRRKVYGSFHLANVLFLVGVIAGPLLCALGIVLTVIFIRRRRRVGYDTISHEKALNVSMVQQGCLYVE